MAKTFNDATNQIIKVQTNKNLIAFYDKLNTTSPKQYAQIHAKGDPNNSGGKDYSLIGITIQDYSAGAGQKNVIVNFNLEPEQLQFILTRLTAGFQEFNFSQDKIFGAPDAQGYSMASKFSITRKAFDNNGQPLRSPWRITIINGKGIRMQNSNGGYYMKGGSFVQEKMAAISVSDMDMFMLLKRVDSYITQWENSVAQNLINEGKKLYSEHKAKIAEQQAPNYQGNYANNYQQQAYPGSYAPQQQANSGAYTPQQQQYYQQPSIPQPAASPAENIMPAPVGYSVGSMGIPDGYLNQ